MNLDYPQTLEDALEKINALADYPTAVIFTLGFQLGTYMTAEAIKENFDTADKIREALVKKLDELSPNSEETLPEREWKEDFLRHVKTLPESNQKDPNQAYSLISWYCATHAISNTQFAKQSKIASGIISQLKYGEYNMQDRIRNKLINFFNEKGYELTLNDIYPQGVPK